MNAPRSSRILCILVGLTLILAPLLVIGALALYWNSQMQTLTTAIEERSDQLTRFRRMIGTLPALRAEIDRVRANDTFKAYYFDAGTAALAGAQLQQRIQDIVTAAEGRLISTQLLPELPDEQPSRVRVRTQIQGTTETLLDVLYEIEQARPFLFVEQVSVRSSARVMPPAVGPRARQIRRPMPNAGGELTIRLDVFGFTLGGES
ncbi:MAG: general secretion pathway protein GspM [Sphingobacteriia bacterium]|nr:general secretion pathway protein GspM [Sphingobacteriia bacterium]NCC38666.1 general secretion pathway protein GspM [Gammaproteobacteria bacterium]